MIDQARKRNTPRNKAVEKEGLGTTDQQEAVTLPAPLEALQRILGLHPGDELAQPWLAGKSLGLGTARHCGPSRRPTPVDNIVPYYSMRRRGAGSVLTNSATKSFFCMFLANLGAGIGSLLTFSLYAYTLQHRSRELRG